jgi:alpha-N-acetylglucosamine transferase
VVDRVKVSSGDILKSELAQHLADYFQAVKIHTTSVSPRNNIQQNAAELGIAPVSGMYIDREDGLPKRTYGVFTAISPLTSIIQ